MSMKHRSLGYRRNLTAWVEMMRARQAAEEAAAVEEVPGTEESQPKQAGGGPPPLLGSGVAAFARAWPGEDVVNEKAAVWQRQLRSVNADESSAIPGLLSRFEPWMSHLEDGLSDSSSGDCDEKKAEMRVKKQKLDKRHQMAHLIREKPSSSAEWTGASDASRTGGVRCNAFLDQCCLI